MKKTESPKMTSKVLYDREAKFQLFQNDMKFHWNFGSKFHKVSLNFTKFHKVSQNHIYACIVVNIDIEF